MPRFSQIPNSTTFRVALLYVGLFVVSMALLLGFIHYATAGYLERQTDAAITAEASELAARFRQGGLGALAREISNKAVANVGRRSVYLLADTDQEPLAGNMSRWPSEVEPNEDGWLEFELIGPATSPTPVRARVYRPGNQFYLLVGRNVESQIAFQNLIATAIAWGVLLSALLALGGGFFTSRIIARRLERINDTAREVMAGDLRQRVPTRATGDEFDRLADNLNRMLDRIEQLMAGVRQVSDNIAHDLRTPLTRLRWRLEKLREGGDRRLLDEALADADGLLQTFHALLRIAEVEASSRRRFAPLDVCALVRDVAELYEPVAAGKQQELVVGSTDDLFIRGDRDLLFQAVANLVDNAVKYGPEGGTIAVGVVGKDGRVEISVADNGPGVPADKRDAVLDRFVRLEASRCSPGSGLGLSLVAAVAQLHHGELRLEDGGPGLRVRLLIPAGG